MNTKHLTTEDSKDLMDQTMVKLNESNAVLIKSNNNTDKPSIRDNFRKFAEETPIQGIKELFLNDAVIGLKIFWAVFLLVCAGLMTKQLVFLAIAYEKELTLTTVSLDEVERNRTGNLNMCINVTGIFASGGKVNLSDDVAPYVGQFRVGSVIIYRSGNPIWLDNDIDTTANMGIHALKQLPIRSSAVRPLSFDKRVNKVLSVFNISELWALKLSGSSGAYGHTWCLVIEYNDAELMSSQQNAVEPEDFYMGYDTTTQLFTSMSFYTITDQPFREASVHTLRLDSSAVQRKKRRHSGEIENDNTRKKMYQNKAFDTHINLKLQARKYTFLNLRRKPCIDLPQKYVLPVGKGRATCYDSCMTHSFQHRYGCKFEKHLDLFDKLDNAHYCHWFDIMRRFRDELHLNCSTGGLFPSVNIQEGPPPPEKDEYFDDISEHDGVPKSSTLYINATENDFDDFDSTDDKRTICDLRANATVWTQYLLYLIKKDIDDKYRISCQKQCTYFRPCVQWEMEYGHIQRLRIYHNDTQEFTSMYITKPDIIANFEEKLETTVEGLIASIGGIFGFYFGFSVVAIVHVGFFFVHRYLNYKVASRKHKKEETVVLPQISSDSFL